MAITLPSFLSGFRMFKGEDFQAVANTLTTAFLNTIKQISAAGISPGATGVDSVLAVFTLPANFFSAQNNAAYIQAQGKFAANAATKQVKIIFNPATAVVGATVGVGGTTIADSGAVVTNGLGWSLQASVFKSGAAGSNTQMAIHEQAQTGGTVSNLLAPSFPTATENAPILIAVTGNATTTATDITFNYLEIDQSN